MEDSHSIHLSLPPSTGAASPAAEDTEGTDGIPKQPEGSTVTNDEREGQEEGNAFFGVFDGHGGELRSGVCSCRRSSAAVFIVHSKRLEP
jgi:serine/threonine protein phosphatase PrpC